MKILITGFEPFGGESVNPSWEAVKLLPDTIDGHTVVKKLLPCVFVKAGDVLDAEIEREKPDFVLCVGQAGGRADETLGKACRAHFAFLCALKACHHDQTILVGHKGAEIV